MPYEFPAQIRFSDTDALAHVNHARYLAYFEDARIAFLNEVTNGQGLDGVQGIILARAEVDYLRPLRPSAEPAKVSLWISHIGTKSFTISYTLEHAGAVAAKATTVIVAYDYSREATRELTDRERDVLQAWA